MQTINTNGTASPVDLDATVEAFRVSIHGLAANDIPSDSTIHLEVEIDGDWRRGGVSWAQGDELTAKTVEFLKGDRVQAVVAGSAISGTFTVKIAD